MASAMCKAMAAELGPERIVRAATLEIAYDTTPAQVAARVCAELRVRSGLDLEVSYSATGERLVRRYQSAGAALAEAASRATAQAGAPFPRGAYVVTGGLGGLGRALVTHLLKAHGESRVLLIGRRAASAVAAEREALGWGEASRVDYAEVDLGGAEGVAVLGAAIASFLQAATL